MLGEPVRTSAVGEPLSVQITVLDGEVSRAAECLRILPGTSEDGLPWVREAKIVPSGHGPSARITVESAAPVAEPALKLAIEDVCDTRLRREYTLLLSFPDTPRASRPVASAEPKAAPTAETSRTREAERPRRPAAAAPRKAPRKADAQPAPAPPRATATRAGPPAAPAAPENDRLVLGGGESRPGERLRLSTELASFARIGSTSDAEREQLRREQNVLMAVDRTIVAQLELNERIRQLEDTQRRIIEQARAATETVDTTAAQRDYDERGWLYLVAIVTGLSLLLAITLLALRRRTYRTVEVVGLTDSEITTSPPAKIEPAEHWKTVAPTTPAPPESVLEAPEATARLREAAGEAGADAEPLPAPPAEEAAEEHESAIELAEIMIGFGRVQGAAETLAEFIQSNPKKSVTPWLKLLDVYRAAGLRSDFDALARQLNKTFNVKSVTWDTFDEARAASKSIEQMPHVVKTLTELWGTPECQAYLEKLLRDNRDGTREGFPLSAIDEILVLAAILEEELGPYRAPGPQNRDVTT